MTKPHLHSRCPVVDGRVTCATCGEVLAVVPPGARRYPMPRLTTRATTTTKSAPSNDGRTADPETTR